MLCDNHMRVGIQAVAVASNGRVTDVAIDGKEQLELCMKLASAVNSTLERQMIMTDEQVKYEKILKMTETLNQIVGELQVLTCQSTDFSNVLDEHRDTFGRLKMAAFMILFVIMLCTIYSFVVRCLVFRSCLLVNILYV